MHREKKGARANTSSRPVSEKRQDLQSGHNLADHVSDKGRFLFVEFHRRKVPGHLEVGAKVGSCDVH